MLASDHITTATSINEAFVPGSKRKWTGVGRMFPTRARNMFPTGKFPNLWAIYWASH